MLLSLWKYVKGCVRISVRGFSRERFLNLLAANDIFAWDIVNRRSQIVLTLTVSGFKRIRPILKKTNCRFKIISRGGLPFIVHKYRRRTVFACGFAIFFLLVFY
ncbi:MAG: sporulation protein YqfD, partial [Firmicutes bacterium]|nr:sporulation protein YqfD [Bacillota bacterium]